MQKKKKNWNGQNKHSKKEEEEEEETKKENMNRRIAKLRSKLWLKKNKKSFNKQFPRARWLHSQSLLNV